MVPQLAAAGELEGRKLKAALTSASWTDTSAAGRTTPTRPPGRDCWSRKATTLAFSSYTQDSKSSTTEKSVRAPDLEMGRSHCGA
jgi:hypothetical protein